MNEWWYVFRDIEKGPMGDDELAALFSGGVLTAETLLWKPGMKSWKPASEISELKSALTARRQSPLATSNLWHRLRTFLSRRRGERSSERERVVARFENETLAKTARNRLERAKLQARERGGEAEFEAGRDGNPVARRSRLELPR